MDKKQLMAKIEEAKKRIEYEKQFGHKMNEFDRPVEKRSNIITNGQVRAEMSGLIDPPPMRNYLNVSGNPSLPKIADEKLVDDWEERMLECASRGGSIKALMLAIGCHDVPSYNYLLSTDEHFKNVHKKCLIIAEVYWEECGNHLVNGAFKNGSSSAWAFNMKNRYNWKEKSETEVNDKTQRDVKINVNFLVPDHLASRSKYHPKNMIFEDFAQERFGENGNQS